MKFSKLGKLVIAAAAVACVSAVSAAPITVGFSLGRLGGVFTGNGAGGDITTSTEVSFTGRYQITGADPLANNLVDPNNDLGLFVTLSNPMPLAIGQGFTKTFTLSSGVTFTENLTVSNVVRTGSGATVIASGMITAIGFDPTPVFWSSSYTQNGGPTAAITFSANNSTTPPPSVPEPGSLALVGLAIAGLAAAGRRRNS